MEALKAALDVYETVAKVGFAGLVTLALIGNYYDVWRWGKTERAREAREAKALADAEARWRQEVVDLKAAAGAREALAQAREVSQQHRIDQLMDRMIEAAGILEKSVSVRTSRVDGGGR